jgi:hypothetical protein
LALAAGGTQPPTTPAAKGKQAATAEASQDRPWVLRVAASMIRAVTRAVRAVTGAAGWLADLWRQADAKTDHPDRSPSTTRPKAEALAPSLALASTSKGRST